MIFLTGASGLVGSHIARHLLAEGKAVRALKRPTSDIQHLSDIAHQIEWVEGDLLDVTFIAKSLQGCQQVVHAAGMVSFSAKDTEALYQTNVAGTAGLVDASLAAGIKRFVHISSVAAIGRPKKSGLVSEEQKWEKSKFNSWYGETKYLGELEVWRGYTEGLPAVIFNPSVVLGPGQIDRSSTRLFNYVLQQHSFFPTGLINWVDVRDLNDLVLKALTSALPAGERYIVSAGAVHYKELFDQMAEHLNVNPPHRAANSVLTTGAYYLEKVRGLFGVKEPLITKETRILSDLEIKFDNSKITNQLNFSFRPLSSTIQWTCERLEAQPL